MAKREYATQEEAQAAADWATEQARTMKPRGMLSDYEVYHARDPITNERKWFIRRKSRWGSRLGSS